MSKPSEPRAKIPSRASIAEEPRKAPKGPQPSSPEIPPAEPLAEVERALSILQGRHPEAVRAERETQHALASRKAEAEARAKSAGAEEKRRWIVRAIAGTLLAGVAIVLGTQYSSHAARGKAVEVALAPALAPYLSRGFTRHSSSRFAEEKVELDATEPTCFVAFASESPGDGALNVERPSGALAGSHSIAWCSCGAEHATVRLRDPVAGGLAVLRVGAPEVGGDHGLFFLDPRPEVVAPGDECSHESLDAWIDKGAVVRAKDDAAPEELRIALARAGFAVVGSAIPSWPFAVVPAAADACALAWSTAPDDRLSLRLPGGERPVVDVKGPLAFCVSRAESLSVWRKGSGEVVVERVAASRLGGTHGVREAATRLGFPAVGAWVSDDDLGWDAISMLRASGIAPPEITVSTNGRATTHARLLALSIAGAMVRADAPQSATYLCEPPLSGTSRSAVCVQSAPLPWQVVGGVGKAGIAEATLPFWMQAFAGTTDPAALPVQLSLVKLGRRLGGEGFEATTLEGVTEADGGAIVMGRAGDDAIVAVQLTREPPWASPCGTEDAWALDGDPAVVSLAAGAQVKLSCLPRVTGPRDRRTVVFRHLATTPPGR
jgi:hypothetical protein